MPILVADCPRCGAVKMTFDVLSYNAIGFQHGWQCWCELFSICRHCHKATNFVVSQKGDGTNIHAFSDPKVIMSVPNASDYFRVERFVSLRDHSKYILPDFIPEEIELIFIEGTTCLSVECWNAAGTMFRQCLDLATKPMLPEGDVENLNNHQRRNLAPRLDWLFENKILPVDLRELAHCIKEDGRDGAHDGTLKREDAFDLLDFTTALLERLYTEPAKIEQAKNRREERRAKLA